MDYQNSLKEIYDEYKNLVFNLTLNYVQNVEDAEEITQDVFVKIYKSKHNFRQRSKISTWIYRITINSCLDFIKAKKAKKRKAVFADILFIGHNETAREPAHFNHPGVELENKEATENLFKLINKLPSKQKTALILSKIEQKSQKEIAEIMKISEKAVESALQRAKKSLAEKVAHSRRNPIKNSSK